MKNFKLIGICIISAGTLLSCGGSEQETSAQDTEEIKIDNLETVEENEPVQIIEDLDNVTFKNYLEEKGGVLIDLRTPEEVSEGSIDGSVNMDFNAGDFERGLDTLDASVPTFVYCHGGGRSGQARDMLKDKGFLEIYNLKNGYGNWDK